MIEEIISILVSILPMISPSSVRLSARSNTTETASEESRENHVYWHGRIHREYEDDIEDWPSELPDNFVSSNYTLVGSEMRIRPSFRRSVWRSLRVNFCIMLAVFPLSLITLALLYFKLNTSNLCFQLEKNHNSVPFSVKKWRLAGENIDHILTNLWFPVSLAILFGWREFKGNYMSTLYVGFGVVAAVVIYNAHLLIFGVFDTNDFYRYPNNFLFLASLLCNSIIVARKIRGTNPTVSLSSLKIVAIISLNFVVAFFLSVAYSYGVIPWFNRLDEKISRVLVASIAPVLVCLPIGISKYFTLGKSHEIIEPERSFVLIYFLHASYIVVYRVMQTDFQSLWIFIGLSLLHSLGSVVGKATKRLREILWKRFINYLKKTSRFQRLSEIQYDTPHQRRLDADLEIQDILFNYAAVVLSRGYCVLNKISRVEVPTWPIVSESLMRISIALGVDLVFNLLAVFIQVHWHDIPVGRVWLRYWKRHMIANVVVLIVIVAYFTRVLLTVFEDRIGNSEAVLRNCSLPFSSW